jgi:hydrogenase/urease accessory protein HupE
MKPTPSAPDDATLLLAVARRDEAAFSAVTVARRLHRPALGWRGRAGKLAGGDRATTMRCVARWGLLLAVVVCGAAPVRAHDPGISTAQGEVRSDVIELNTGFAPADVEQLVPPEARDEGRMTAEQFEKVRVQLEAIAPRLWELRAGEVVIPPRSSTVQLLTGDSVNFQIVWPRPAGAEQLTLRAPQLGNLPPGHRQFVIVTDDRGSALAKKLLSVRDTAIELPLAGAGPPEVPPTFWSFVRLGVEHIWTGYDHLLFLFALLIVCRSFRSIVAIISCFTVAHSLTLALATLNVVNLPSRLVEPAIAASIVFVGVENLARRGAEPRGRWALTFAFGLIHGFGFASVLRELGVGRGSQGIAMPLFTFNLGVEVGQIVVAAVVLPLVWQLRKNEKFVQRGVPLLSALVAAAGLYWLLQRTVFA